MKTLLIIAALALTLPAYSQNYTDWTQPFDVDANTMGLWHFDETTGATNVVDATGNSPDGTLIDGLDPNKTWKTSMPGFGNMASTWWNSSSDYNYGEILVDCPANWADDPLAIGPDQDLTIEFWAKVQYANYRMVLQKVDIGEDYWVGWGAVSTDGLDVGWYGDGNWTSLTSGIAAVIGAWHHYAICIDRTTSADDVATFWKDGVQVGAAQTAARTRVGNSSGDLRMLGENGTRLSLNDIDELRISNKIRYPVPASSVGTLVIVY